MLEEVLTMSSKELKRLEMVQKVIERRVLQRDAAEYLSIGTRQVKRLVASYRMYGPAGLVSKKRGKRSNRAYPADFKKCVIDTISIKYNVIFLNFNCVVYDIILQNIRVA